MKKSYNKNLKRSAKKLNHILFAIALSAIGFINSVKSQSTIYSTDFGAVANVNPAGWSFTGVDMNISTNTPSTGYIGVSGAAYMGEGNSNPFVNTSGTSEPSSQIGTSAATLLVNTTGYTGITIGFGMRKSSAGYNTNATYTLEWSTDNSTYTAITYTEPTAGTWGLASGVGLSLPAAADNQATLYIRWTFIRTGPSSNYKIDDFSVKGTAAVPGAIRITEYMYSGNGSGSAGEFVEFTNVGGGSVDMTGWSFDDNSQTPGSQSLSAFGIVQPGESVILTEVSASTFRTNWNLCAQIKVIGGSTNGLAREDEINLYDASNALVDRLTYGDQTFSPGSIRTNSTSGWVNAAGLGTNTITNWTLSVVADAEASYASSLGEIGSPGKSTRATVAYNPCPPVNSAPTIVMNTISTTDYLDQGVIASPASPYGISGTINDPTDPLSTLGVDFTISDVETAVGSLTVTATSSNTVVVPNTNVIVIGSGASRNVKVTPADVGYSNITVTVNDGTSTASYIISYGASIASATPVNTFWHTGMSDGSDAIAIDDNFYICGDDEENILNVYSRAASGLPLASFNYTAYLNLPDLTKPEVDLEAGAKSTTNTNKVYWLGSMSNGKSPFNDKPNRNRIFATTQSGTGASTTFSFVGYYGNLRAQLISWGDANGYNFTASAAAGVDSKTISGFAAEGLVFGPDNTTLYIGMRAPLVPTNNRTKAVIAPIVNFETWFNNGTPSGNPTFAAPIELDLGGRGLRDLTRLSNGTYIIVAGNPAGSPLTSAIYKWTGNPADAPILVSTSANGVLNLEGVMQVNTGGNLSLNKLQVVTDGGDEDLYNDGSAAKDFSDLHIRKFRSDNLNSIDLCMTSTGDTTAIACSNFMWHGTNYTTSGTPTKLFTTSSGCDSIVTLHLTINPVPSNSVTVSGTTTFCQGNSVVFTAPAGNNYQWQLNGNPIGGATANTYTATAAGNYNVVITNVNSCSGTSATELVTVNALPTVTASLNNPSICNGNSTTLSAGGATTYLWNTGSASASFIVFPSVTTSYTVTGTNANGCSNTAVATLTVNALPMVTVSVTNSAICAGDASTITAGGATSYLWNTGSTNTSVNVSPANTAAYSVTGTGSNGCTNSASITIAVNPLPVISIGTSLATVCVGNSATLTANGGNTYLWSTSATTSTISVSPSAATTYSVTGTDNNGCVNTSSTTVTVNSLPTVSFALTQNTICVNDGIQNLSSSPSGGIFSGTGVSGTDFDPSVSGNGTFGITYLYTDANGCSANATDNITVNTCTSLEQTAALTGIKIYPNPNNGNFTLSADTEGETILELFDVAGKLVFDLKTRNRTELINVENLADGIYQLRITTNKTNATQRIVIAK